VVHSFNRFVDGSFPCRLIRSGNILYGATGTGGSHDYGTVFSLTLGLFTEPPAITTQPADATVNAGADASFTVAATGAATLAYQWQVSADSGVTWSDLANAGSYAGVNLATLTVHTTSGLDARRYRARVSNAAGSVTSDSAILTVRTAPGITTQPVNQTVSTGLDATYMVAASGSPAPSYQWQVSTDGGSTWSNLANAGAYGGVNLDTLTVHTNAGLNGYRYRAQASNAAGSATSNSATLTLTAPVLASLAVTPANPSLAVGATQQFAATGLLTDGTTVSLTTGANAWTSGTAIPQPSYALGAAFVGGKFYAISGFATARVAVYDPALNTWTTAAPLPVFLQYFGTAVVDGKIYVVGGDTGGGGDRATLYRYDPALNTWQTLASMPLGARWGVRAAVVGGRIYAIGGHSISGNAYLNRVEIYDPATNTWTTGTPLPAPLYVASVGTINGKIYVAGGANATGALVGASEFDPATTTWRALAPMLYAQTGNSAVVDGKLHIIGGGSSGETGLQAYDPATDSWSASLAPMPTGRHEVGVAADEVNRKIYAVGGWNGAFTPALEIFTPPVNFTWSSSSPGIASITFGGLATGLANGTTTISATFGALTGGTLLTVTAGAPEISVFDGPGTAGPEFQTDTGVTGFAAILAGTTGTPRTITIKNTGTATLTGLALTKAGTQPADFTLGGLGAITLAPAATTTFTITFAPVTTGTRAAQVLIASNDANENPFAINVSGTGLSPVQSWRQTYFGTSANSGNAADTADTDVDGIPNLLEYALGLSPLVTNATGLPVVNVTADHLTLTFNRAAGTTDITYKVEATASLGGTWTEIYSATGPTVGDQVTVTDPLALSGNPRRFLRLKVVTAQP
ncbi:MAG: hypothetical protein RIQ79_1441, partial [Verrucomicrobiota bacterium]